MQEMLYVVWGAEEFIYAFMNVGNVPHKNSKLMISIR